MLEQCAEPFARRVLQWGQDDYYVGVVAYWNPWGEIECPHRHATEEEAKSCGEREATRRQA